MALNLMLVIGWLLSMTYFVCFVWISWGKILLDQLLVGFEQILHKLICSIHVPFNSCHMSGISCYLLNLAWMLLLYLWLLSYLLSLYLETLNLFHHIWESSGLVSYIMTIGNIPSQYESCWRYVVNICFFIDFYCGIVIFLILI